MSNNAENHEKCTCPEVWADIEGYEGLYQISSKGRIRNARGKIKNPFVNGGGYLQVVLCKHGKTRKPPVHRLVGFAFLGKPQNNKRYIDHLNNDKTHNCVCNLEWVTMTENMRRAHANGLMERGKSSPEMAKEILRDYFKHKMSQRQLAEKYGISRTLVQKIVQRKMYPEVVWDVPEVDKQG